MRERDEEGENKSYEIFCYLWLLQWCYSAQFDYESFKWKTHTHSLNRMHIQKVIWWNYAICTFDCCFQCGCYYCRSFLSVVVAVVLSRPRIHWNEAAAFHNRNSKKHDVGCEWISDIFPYTFSYRLVCRRRRHAEPAILMHLCCPVELSLFPSCMPYIVVFNHSIPASVLIVVVIVVGPRRQQ